MSRPDKPSSLSWRGNLPRSCGSGPECLLGLCDCLPGGIGGLVEAAADLWVDDHRVIYGVVVRQRLDVVADHLLGPVQVPGLRHADAVDVKFPAVLPALGAHVVDAHWSHPSGRQTSFLIVSRTMPGETMRACTITAMCFPHGQYHFW
jgi:hypothetical protein